MNCSQLTGRTKGFGAQAISLVKITIFWDLGTHDGCRDRGLHLSLLLGFILTPTALHLINSQVWETEGT